MKEELNLTIPEWVFLHGNSQLGNALQNRVILQHVPSFTIMELIALDETVLEVNSTVRIKEFTCKNIYG